MQHINKTMTTVNTYFYENGNERQPTRAFFDSPEEQTIININNPNLNISTT